jgi:signal transduction histidine kinase
MIYTNGEVIGVLRFVTSTRLLDSQVLRVGLVAFGVFAVFIAVILLFSNLFIRSVLESIREITAKAKRIAGGSYGVQIEIKNEDELGELAETINELSVQISQNEKAQTEFISSLSHELRTPLTAINGWGETLLSGGGLHTKEAKRGMQIIVRETQRLTEMVVSLLDFTRMQDGRMTLNVEPTDIRAEFEDTVYMYSSRLQQEGILLEYQDTDEEIEEIPCDGKRMRQVFLNILDNAAKHGGDGGRIDASISQEDGFVVVRIRDYGHGIPEDELPLVKHRFYKGSTKARGTGIGLAVSDEIVLLHGGELLLSNAPGGGTLVTVRLPVHP